MSNYVRCIDNTGYQVSLPQGAGYKVLSAGCIIGLRVRWLAHGWLVSVDV
jgi:hypothetical protein